MRKILLLLVMVPFVLAAEKTESAKKKKVNDTFVVKLADGSQLVSKPVLNKIPLKTTFAEMQLPLQTVQKIKFDKKTDIAAIDFLNGDKLQGKLNITSIEAHTILGKQTIKLDLITEILSKIKMPPVYNDSPEKRKNCINNLRHIDGAKEQWALAKNKTRGDQVVTNEVNRYIRYSRTPICPAGGTYKYNDVDHKPECTVSGHAWLH